jgi:hypothetical protein
MDGNPNPQPNRVIKLIAVIEPSVPSQMFFFSKRVLSSIPAPDNKLSIRAFIRFKFKCFMIR